MPTLVTDPSIETQPESQAPVRRDVRVALWPVVVVLYATLLPREMRLSLGGLEFYADRICLILLLPFIVQKLFEGAIRLVLPDLLMVFAGIWMIVSMSVLYGFGTGLERGGAVALDGTAGYFLARISFRSLADLRRGLIIFAPGAFAAGAIMMVESVTHVPIARPLVETVFASLPFDAGAGIEGQEHHRLGLMRAQGTFSHSILGGLYLATLIGIYSLSGLRGWPRWLGSLAGLFSFFSLSSAALLGIFLSYGLIVFDMMQRRVRELSWPLFLSVMAAMAVLVEIGSNEGLLGVMIRNLTFNPETGYFRSLIWEYGSASVAAHPWFGIGLAQYDRPSWMVSASVDAHWLVLAMRYGLPVAIAQGVAVIASIWALTKSGSGLGFIDNRFYHGMAISMGVLATMMFTVMLWGGVLGWFNLLLGACVSCAQPSFRQLLSRD